ncbi:MAG: Multidrug resistance protein MexA precursor [Syntrophaceae bacterium PtaU1.Bin231]|nr:MAG: Multidrug resistance protein MexA precursor [Syntrophaceae bacterium PtaU1.Bin231]
MAVAGEKGPLKEKEQGFVSGPGRDRSDRRIEIPERCRMQTRNKNKKIAAGLVLTGMLMLGGCGQQSAPGGASQGFVPEVAVLTVQPKRLVMTTELTGRTAAHRTAEVRPQVGGIIQKRLFTEGADVKAGQLLYSIDPATYRAALDNARAALGRSEASLQSTRTRAERLRELLADKAVSQQEYDDAAAALKQTEADIQYWKAAVETARINLGHTAVTAPISGRIGRSNVTEGALVAAYQPAPLAVIQQLDPMYVDVTQSTAELLRLRKRLEEGMLQRDGALQSRIRLVLEDGSRYPLTGTLQFRDVTVDPTTGSVILRMVFPNPQGVLLPGMFVRAQVDEGVNPRALLVPQQAVSRDPKGNALTLIVDAESKVQQRMLTLDRAVGNAWLVIAGLAAGDRVIVEGLQKVRPGASVKTVPFQDAAGNNGAGQEKANPPAAGENGRR